MSDERITGFDEDARAIPRQIDPPNHPPPAAQSGALVTQDFGDEAGAGMEGLSQDEQSPPFLKLAQGLSPELDPGAGSHIHGLQLGSIFESVSQSCFDGRTGIDLTICWRTRHFGKWVPRDLGGGFRGMLQGDDPFLLRTLAAVGNDKFRLPRYNPALRRWSGTPVVDPDSGEEIELIETGQLYVLYGPHGELSPETARRAIISMTKTAYPIYVGIFDRANSWTFSQPKGPSNPTGARRPAPIYRWVWHVTSRDETRKENSFKNWHFQRIPSDVPYQDALLPVEDPLYDMGREFYLLARQGRVKVNYDANEPAGREPDDAPPF